MQNLVVVRVLFSFVQSHISMCLSHSSRKWEESGNTISMFQNIVKNQSNLVPVALVISSILQGLSVPVILWQEKSSKFLLVITALMCVVCC